jgi:hypothetical protein
MKLTTAVVLAVTHRLVVLAPIIVKTYIYSNIDTLLIITV